jgi:hypothetical protein
MENQIESSKKLLYELEKPSAAAAKRKNECRGPMNSLSRNSVRPTLRLDSLVCLNQEGAGRRALRVDPPW